MKKAILTLTTASLITLSFLLMGCQTDAQKTSAKKENVQDAQADLDQAKKEVALQKIENAAAWDTFKRESALRVSDNNKRIAELKAKMLVKGSEFDQTYTQRITALEEKNKELDMSLQTFENTNNSDWEAFRISFNQGMDDLGTAITNIDIKD